MVSKQRDEDVKEFLSIWIIVIKIKVKVKMQ